MADSNVSRARATERFQKNKRAFDEIIGDPFAHPEPIYGQYHLLKRRSSISAAKNNFDEGRTTGNKARPSIVDFFCDVERTIENAISEKNILIKFADTYINESTDTAFTAKERSEIEQVVGKAFREHGISPVTIYFTAIRQ
jgi:hypothetical protein